MSAAPQFDLTTSHRRSCFWAPDYAWLSLLKPAQGRVLSIGPRIMLAVTDAANQTLAASAQSTVTISAGAITAGSWPNPSNNQAYFFEALAFAIIATDASGKLQLAGIGGVNLQGYGIPFTLPGVPMPFTWPGAGGSGFTIAWNGVAPIMLLNGGPPGILLPANGPVSFPFLVNTDGAGAHTYKRSFSAIYRIIDGVDFTTGPSIPGAGIGI